jgi:hypothetical protein
MTASQTQRVAPVQSPPKTEASRRTGALDHTTVALCAVTAPTGATTWTTAAFAKVRSHPGPATKTTAPAGSRSRWFSAPPASPGCAA